MPEQEAQFVNEYKGSLDNQRARVARGILLPVLWATQETPLDDPDSFVALVANVSGRDVHRARVIGMSSITNEITWSGPSGGLRVNLENPTAVAAVEAEEFVAFSGAVLSREALFGFVERQQRIDREQHALLQAIRALHHPPAP